MKERDLKDWWSNRSFIWINNCWTNRSWRTVIFFVDVSVIFWITLFLAFLKCHREVDLEYHFWLCGERELSMGREPFSLGGARVFFASASCWNTSGFEEKRLELGLIFVWQALKQKPLCGWRKNRLIPLFVYNLPRFTVKAMKDPLHYRYLQQSV